MPESKRHCYWLSNFFTIIIIVVTSILQAVSVAYGFADTPQRLRFLNNSLEEDLISLEKTTRFQIGSFHALVIGNQHYKYLRPLETPIVDAKAVAELLKEHYGFAVTLLLDADRDGLVKAISSLRSTMTDKDSLLIYYAGHGFLDKTTGVAYWHPVNARRHSDVYWVSTSRITDTLRAVQARHVLVVSDSCYSGSLLRDSGAKLPTGRDEWLRRMFARRSRTALTSGGLEPVLDFGSNGHSVFAEAFLKILWENREILDGDSLFDQIKQAVVLRADQTPQYGNIKKAGQNFKQGDFLFVPKELQGIDRVIEEDGGSFIPRFARGDIFKRPKVPEQGSRGRGTGRDISKLYKPLVVQITTKFSRGQEDGFGFLVGERYNQFYIVTANHVVRKTSPDNPTEKVLLRFSWDPGGHNSQAELLDTMYKPLDLALLRIDKKAILGASQVDWKGKAWCRQWQEEEKAWFIGRARKWYVPSDRSSGVLLHAKADLQGFIEVDIDSVQPGTSGAPLLIKNGLVGMVVSDSPNKVRVVNIDHIRRFVTEENPYPWNLSRYDSNQSNVVSQGESLDSGKNSQPSRFAIQKNEKNVKKRSVRSFAHAEALPYVSQLLGDDNDVTTLQPIAMELADNSSTVPPEKLVEQPVFVPPKTGDSLLEPLTKMNFIRLPADCFSMGSPKGDKERYSDEEPAHPACVDAFWMGKYEVTLAQWAKIMGKKPARSQGSGKHPAVPVTWEEVQGFISKLHKKTGRVFRLPTEAEWEYAARAGTDTARYWGDDISCDRAMYGNDANNNSCVDYVPQQRGTVGGAAPVGSYPPNQFGLHDMLGNVREWCADWYGKEYYLSSPKDNPTGPSASSVAPQARVLRGGSWLDGSRIIRSAARKWLAPKKRYYDTGFRLVLDDPKGTENRATQ